MFFAYLAVTVGILGGVMLLVVIFSLLTMAKRAEARAEKLYARGWEEGQLEDRQSLVEKVPTNQEPFEKVMRIPRMSRSGLPQ